MIDGQNEQIKSKQRAHAAILQPVEIMDVFSSVRRSTSNLHPRCIVNASHMLFCLGTLDYTCTCLSVGWLGRGGGIVLVEWIDGGALTTDR